MANVKSKSITRKKQKAESASEFNDLCQTCNFGPTCARRKHHNKPVWFCEEFDDYQPAPRKMMEREKKSQTAAKASSLVQGLCVNCEYNLDCAIPKSEAGIWHCEEYR